MRRPILAAVCAALMFVGAHAQVHGVPPSVTSLGPGRSFAPPASVTSLGPRGWNDSPVLLGNPFVFGGPIQFHPRLHQEGRDNLRGGHRRGNADTVVVPYAFPVGPGYYGDYGYADDAATDMQSGAGTPTPNVPYRGSTAPTANPGVSAEAYSRYGTHYLDQRESVDAMPRSGGSQAPPASLSASEPEPKTILVFKDGHRLQITNYVIQGSTLYNVSGEGPRKIALADLDVDATTKANDDRGIDFKLP